jgi:serine/threonine protein phosphatase PrpC
MTDSGPMTEPVAVPDAVPAPNAVPVPDAVAVPDAVPARVAESVPDVEPVPAVEPPAAPVPVDRHCPRCEFAVGAADLFCEECGFDFTNGQQDADPPSADPRLAGTGAVGRARAEAGEEIGGLDVDSVRFDAAATQGGPPRRPGVRVMDIDLDSLVATCPACQGAIAVDGYCEQCGTAAPRPRDHWVERPAPWVALACDRGIRHAINQDGAAVGACAEPNSFAALVVCDGVSSAARSELASLAAARAARDVLVAPRPGPSPDGVIPVVPSSAAPLQPAPAGEPAGQAASSVPGEERPVGSSAAPSRASLLAAAMREAGLAAQDRAVAAASDPPEYNPPACTFAAAVIDGPVVVAGWVGDSRVYWLPDEGIPVQLSEDDSLAAEAIRQGLSREDAERSPHAHSITRWLGLDAPDPVPRTAVRRIDTAAWVLVCSDGLWNYCSEAAAMHDLVKLAADHTGHDVTATAEALVAWAVDQGGHDNIAVVLARVG